MVPQLLYLKNIACLCLLDPLILSQLCNRMPSPMGESAVDCGRVSSMPSVSFTIGRKIFKLSPQEVRCDPKLSRTSFAFLEVAILLDFELVV